MARSRLAVALVVPEPQRTEVDGLRRAVGGQIERIEPHITLVPPVNVADGSMPDAIATLRAAAAAVEGPMRLTIGPAATFMPANRVLYLRVDGRPIDVASLGRLRSQAMRGVLHREERRSFVPHVTLTNRLGEIDEEPALALLAGYLVEVTFTRLDLLRYDEEQRRWSAVADVPLGPAHVVGTGGLALELTPSSHLDPEASSAGESWLGAAAVPSPSGPEVDPLVVAARREGRVVGIVTGGTSGPWAGLDLVVVAAQERRTGIGTHLLATFELAAAHRGARRVEAGGEVPADVAALLRSRGWASGGGAPTLSSRLIV